MRFMRQVRGGVLVIALGCSSESTSQDPDASGGSGGAGSGSGGSAGSGSGGGGEGGAGAGDGSGGSAGSGGSDTGGASGSSAGGSGGSDTGGASGSSTGGSGGSDTGGTSGSSAGGSAGSSSGGTSGSSTGGSAGSGGQPPCTLADSWETIDDFQLTAGEHSNPAAVAVAAPNQLYAVGVARMGAFQWYVRRSDDGGGTWETVDSGTNGGANDVVVTASGAVFVAGNTAAGRIVRRSTDAGETWMTVDTIPGGDGNDPCSAGNLARTASDALYFAAGCDSTGVVVRRSADGGDTWAEVDAFQYTTTAATRMGTLGVDASGQAYVGGHATQPLDGSTHWLIRRGTGAGTWNTVDDFQLAASNHASAATFFGSADAIYVAGSANDAGGLPHFVLRRASIDDPSNFATVDDLAPTEMMGQRAAQSGYLHSSGVFLAAGSSKVGTEPARVIYRRSTDGESWSPAGDYQYVTGADSGPVGRFSEDVQGNVYAMVRGVDAQGFAHWILRRLSCS